MWPVIPRISSELENKDLTRERILPPIHRLFVFSFFLFFCKGFLKGFFVSHRTDRPTDPKSGNGLDAKRKNEKEKKKEREKRA